MLWLLAALVGVLVCVAFLVRDALTAKDALEHALDGVPAAEQAVRDGDAEAARRALADVQPWTESARTHTDGWLWWVAAHVPGVGADAHAVTVTSASVDTITQDVLPPLVEAAGLLSAGGSQGGGVALAPVAAVAPQVVAASSTMDDVVADLAAIDTSALLPVLADPVEQVQDKSVELAGTVAAGATLAELLPPMLGDDGPRRYLLMSLNSAELRAAGGIPGAVAALDVEDGAVTLGPQLASGDLMPGAEPVGPIDPEDLALYSDRLGRFPQDTVLTPDFPTAASLLTSMWQRAEPGQVDGVIATDPVALSYLLGATGPVRVRGVDVTQDDAVAMLLRDAYAEHEAGPETDAFFADVAAAVLSTLTTGGTDPAAAADALFRAAGEHRIQVWSTHEDEAARLQDTVVSGALDASPRAASSLGVFFNDAVSGKMSYYLDSSVEVVASRCEYLTRVDTVDVTLTSTAPADAATSLPAYVTGLGPLGWSAGDIVMNVVVYSPVGGSVGVVTRGDQQLTGGLSTTHGRRGATQVTQLLAPGDSVVLRVEVTSLGAGPGLGDADARRASRTGELDVWSTPTVTEPGLQTVAVPSCT
ncbi:uncharacterized protein DUF4012 [Sediminihabitans luteus]|uniref:Uncharacterized protein DUF4012 n=1 Tax=Sediminihabitans luteus TaxID=1138585 RepID=A0A2M9CEJ1_9CELL|nr:uncharacterized protein DUF4012 [Sediminihabitans luteus]